MKIRPRYIILIAIAAILIFSFQIIKKAFVQAEANAFIMGTPVRVKVDGPYAFLYARMAIDEMARLEQSLSNKISLSEISIINQLAGLAPLQLSPDAYECLNLSQEMYKLTGGAFDITMGHPEALVIDHKNRKAFIKEKGIKIYLGGIGKGFAVEKARELLVKEGAQSGIIDMRSSIAVFGNKSRIVGIQEPEDKENILGTVELMDNKCLSTSGNYERGNHILDPRIKQPAHSCLAVTVIGSDAGEIDALSTAVFVLGPKDGLKLIESLPGTEALIIDQAGKLHLSKGFTLLKS